MRDQAKVRVTAREVPKELLPIWPGALDPDAVGIIRRLLKQGHRAYLVGGCVRDLLLGKIPKDFDVATSARPRQIKKVCRNSRIIGRRFRLVHVHFAANKVIEVSTFRQDPRAELPELGADTVVGEDLLIVRDNVFGTEEEDARRRDFTINGLFFDLEEDTIFDYVGGVEDLRRRVLRTIGDPARRLREDPVRILRAVKFATRLDLTLDAELAAAMAEYHGELARSAPPRVFEEILRMLGGPAPARSVEILARLGILWLLIPELGIRPHQDQDLRLQRLLDRLVVLQEMDRGLRQLPTALYFMVLLYDEAMDRLRGGPSSSSHTVAALDDLLRPFALRCRLSRRDTARMRSMLLALKRIDPTFPSPRKRRRRRTPLREFVRREYFSDALLLFKVLCRAEDRDQEALKVWEARAEEVAGLEPLPEERSDEEKSRRRRRRPRRSNKKTSRDL